MAERDTRSEESLSGVTPEASPSLSEEGGCVEVRIEDLDLENGPYCTSFGRDETALRSSVRRAGVLNPPLVYEQGEGAWDVVAGFGRLRALRDSGKSTCLCRDLTASGLLPLDLLLLGLYENLGTRDLNPVEKAMALARLEPLVSGDALEKTYGPLLGLPGRPGAIEDYLALSLAEAEIRLAVASGRLCMRAFRLLRGWSSADRIEVVSWIEKLKYNTNKQLQIIDIIMDLMEEKGVDAKHLLAEPALSEILDQADDNPPQAAARLLKAFRRLRFPTLAEAERSFQRRVSSLELPKGVSVIHPAYFEGSEFRLEIRFRSGRELVGAVRTLNGTSGLEALGPPWKGEV